MGELVRRSQEEGDPGAFGAPYRTQVGRVYALCPRLSGDADQASEMTQIAFIHFGNSALKDLWDGGYRTSRRFRGSSRAFSAAGYRETFRAHERAAS